MIEDLTDILREQAREQGRLILGVAPWAEIEHRLTLLLVEPPAVPWAGVSATAVLWLITDGAAARTLPDGQREPLLGDGVLRLPAHATGGAAGAAGAGAIDFTAFTLERIEGALAGVGRRSLELRWSMRRAEPLHDPLRRHDQLAAAAARIPEDSFDRIMRPLYLQAYESLRMLEAVLAAGQYDNATVAAGEAAGALTRIACVLEEGIHPPARWLLPAARETDLGGRITSWLDDLPAAASGDEAAARRVRDGCDAVLRAATSALHPRFGSADWLLSPEASTLWRAR